MYVEFFYTLKMLLGMLSFIIQLPKVKLSVIPSYFPIEYDIQVYIKGIET